MRWVGSVKTKQIRTTLTINNNDSMIV